MIREMMCLLALAGVMAGCTNDGSSELQRPETTIRLTAELQQGSRTVLGDDGLKVLWENQDRLGVFSDKGDANVSFLLSEGAGESVGRFEGRSRRELSRSTSIIPIRPTRERRPRRWP